VKPIHAGVLFALAAAGLEGCGSGSCVEVSPSTCTPLYAPTYSEVFTRTLKPTCGQGTTSCHSAAGAQGGLVFEEAGESHRLLTEVASSTGRPRVVGGDAACSLLVTRLESTRPDFQMPPGAPLTPSERCAIIQWVQSGAAR
jgi:hypothetical protein